MRLLRLTAIAVVLLVLAGAMLGAACAGAKGEQGEKGDTGAQGLQGIQGEPGPNMIAVAGTVLPTGEVGNAYNFTNCTWDAIARCYRIELAGISDATVGYVALVTPFSSTSGPNVNPLVNFAEGSPNDVLVVNMIDTAAARQQCGFHFMVFKTT